VKIVGMGRPEEQDQDPSDVRALTRHERTLARALRHALAEGEASGPAVPFDFDAFIAARKAP
jgi:antitoxin ParD1/3/4